nr:zinc finger, CCHC-type [Tanacetum cinerariifolium]
MGLRYGDWLIIVSSWVTAWMEVSLGAAGYRQVKVPEFFDCLGSRQGVEDLRELLRKESMECILKNVFGLRWNRKELKGIVKLRFFSSTQQCIKSEVAKHLGVAGIQQQNGLVNETNVTFFAKLARDREHLACELFGYIEDNNEVAFAVAVVEKIYAHELLTFNNIVACEVISKWKARLKDDMDARPDAEIWTTKGLLDKEKRNVLGMEIIIDHSGNTLRVSQSRFYNRKLIQTLLEGHFILSLEGSLSGDCDVEKNDVGMLDNFDRGLQTAVQVFVDFDYALRRSIAVMESIYELRLVVGIATSALVKGGSRSEVPAQVEVAAYRKGGSWWFVVPISYLDQPLFQDLLRHSEEEHGFDHAMGGLTIPCHEDVFVELTARLHCSR